MERADEHGDSGSPNMVEIVEAVDEAQLRQVRDLFEEYAILLRGHEGAEDVLDAQGFADELARLPGDYARPHGFLLLAVVGGEGAGCVALRSLAPRVAELKRLYVRSRRRGHAVGRRLVESALARAAAMDAGYESVRLDTLPFMHEATRLYRSLGFAAIAPYRENPMPGSLFMECRLRQVRIGPGSSRARARS